MMKIGEGTIPAMIADPILGNELVGWVGAIIFAFKVMIFDSNHIENKLSYQPTVLKQLIWWVGLDHIKKLITYTHIKITKEESSFTNPPYMSFLTNPPF
jgi:hypothetical protein